MNITNARYEVDQISGDNATISCDIDGQFHSVPLRPGNRHYDEIMRQVEAGELTIQDAE